VEQNIDKSWSYLYVSADCVNRHSLRQTEALSVPVPVPMHSSQESW